MISALDDREKIELWISCRNLKDKDFIGKSDPYAKLTLLNKGVSANLGVTETLQDNLNPNFKKTFLFDYIFEQKQMLKIELFDKDEMTKDDLLGSVETSVGKIMGSQNQVCTLDLVLNGKPAGKVSEGSQFIWWQWSGVKLANVDGWFDKSDPFLRFFRQKGNDWLLVHETVAIKDNLDPVWEPFEISCAKLSGNEMSQVFKVECWDYEKNEKHQLIGGVQLTLSQIFEQNQSLFSILNAKNKPAGSLKILQKTSTSRPTFIDYLRGGTQISLCVAIDYTGSNGDPKNPNSLHCIKKEGMNQYQSAIWEIGELLMNYDYDKKFPVFGFGGKPNFPNYKKATPDHCFPLTGDINNYEVFGVEGIFQAYSFALQSVALSGPTYFSFVVTQAMQIAQAHSQYDIYTVLLILTDGQIHDMDKTLQLVKQSAEIPLSIIIIGVGDEDFTSMKILDGDKGFEKGALKRDLVQFVAYNDFKGNISLLSQEVLAELPKQLTKYMELVGKKPKQAANINLSQFNV